MTVNQKSALQVPVEVFTDEDEKIKLGTGYVYLQGTKQSLQLITNSGELMEPGWYFLKPDHKNERLVIIPGRVQ